MKYIISIVITLMSIPLAGAQVSKFVPSQIKIGTDLSYIGSTLLSPDRQQFELNGDIDFHNYFISLDYGLSDMRIRKTDYTYGNTGHYYRMGIDYNLIGSTEDDKVIFFGLRYAGTDFNESFAYTIEDPLYGTNRNEINNIERSGRWFEAVTGMKVNIWKGVYLGWTARFKFSKKVISSPSTLSTFRIPGYGKAINDSAWGINYHLFYQIPIREKKVPEKSETGTENTP